MRQIKKAFPISLGLFASIVGAQVAQAEVSEVPLSPELKEKIKEAEGLGIDVQYSKDVETYRADDQARIQALITRIYGDYQLAIDDLNRVISDIKSGAIDGVANNAEYQRKLAFYQGEVDRVNAENKKRQELYDKALEAYKKAKETFGNNGQLTSDYQKKLDEYNKQKEQYDKDLAEYNRLVTEIQDKTKANADAKEFNQKEQERYDRESEKYRDDKAKYDTEYAEYQKKQAKFIVTQQSDKNAEEEYKRKKSEYDAKKSQYDTDKKAYDARVQKRQQEDTQYQADKAKYDADKKAYDDAVKKQTSDNSDYQAKLTKYNADKAKYDTDKTKYDADQKAYDQRQKEISDAEQHNRNITAANNTAKTKYQQDKQKYDADKAKYDKDHADWLKSKTVSATDQQRYQQEMAEYNKKLAEYKANKIHNIVGRYDTEYAHALQQLLNGKYGENGTGIWKMNITTTGKFVNYGNLANTNVRGEANDASYFNPLVAKRYATDIATKVQDGTGIERYYVVLERGQSVTVDWTFDGSKLNDTGAFVDSAGNKTVGSVRTTITNPGSSSPDGSVVFLLSDNFAKALVTGMSDSGLMISTDMSTSGEQFADKYNWTADNYKYKVETVVRSTANKDMKLVKLDEIQKEFPEANIAGSADTPIGTQFFYQDKNNTGSTSVGLNWSNGLTVGDNNNRPAGYQSDSWMVTDFSVRSGGYGLTSLTDRHHGEQEAGGKRFMSATGVGSTSGGTGSSSLPVYRVNVPTKPAVPPVKPNEPQPQPNGPEPQPPTPPVEPKDQPTKDVPNALPKPTPPTEPTPPTQPTGTVPQPPVEPKKPTTEPGTPPTPPVEPKKPEPTVTTEPTKPKEPTKPQPPQKREIVEVPQTPTKPNEPQPPRPVVPTNDPGREPELNLLQLPTPPAPPGTEDGTRSVTIQRYAIDRGEEPKKDNTPPPVETPKKKRITSWKTPDGKDIIPPREGEHPDNEGDDIPGYRKIRTYTDEDGNIINEYEKVTTEWRDEDGNELKPSEDGDKPDKEGDDVPGYKLTKIKREGSKTINVYTKGPITKWVDKEGNKLKDNEAGEHPDSEGDDIPGYRKIRTDVDKDGNVTNVYEKVIKTKWVDKNGNKLKDDKEGNHPDNEGDDVPGYRKVRTYTDEDGNIVNEYEKVIKTKWVDEKGNPLKDEQEGEHPDKEGDDISGYELVKTETDKDGNIVNIYRKKATPQPPVQPEPPKPEEPAKQLPQAPAPKQLPKTGDTSSSVALAMAILGMGTALGVKRRKREE